MDTGIPKEIDDIMKYLSTTFSKTMKDPVNSRDDLYQDLVVMYLENLGSGKIKEVHNKNHWFIFFKSALINKYHRSMKEKSLFEKTFDDERVSEWDDEINYLLNH